MTMTTGNMNAPVDANPVAQRAKTPAEIAADNAIKLASSQVKQPPTLTADQIKAAADFAKLNLAPEGEEDPLVGAKDNFEDQVKQESRTAAQVMVELDKKQAAVSGVSIRDLTEDDAYNLDIAIAAGAMYSPNFLKVVLKDANYVPRWGNCNSIRMSQLVAQGFVFVRPDEVANLDTLEMFLDSRGHFKWTDLTLLKIPKNIYYAGLRKAYIKSLHATNSKKASEAGASFATRSMTGDLSGAERSYMAQHQEQSGKPIYNPNIGV